MITALEKFDAFVRQALKKGIQEICITDHMPLSISNAADRLPKGRVGEYCRCVCSLAHQYTVSILNLATRKNTCV